MNPRPLLAAFSLLLATWIPWALSERAADPPPACGERALRVRVDPDTLRGALPIVACGCPAGACAVPRGAPGLLLGRPIDLDTASADELAHLPGVGPGTARRIVADRDRRGAFRTVQALARVKGLGAARIRALDGWARAGPTTAGTRLPRR